MLSVITAANFAIALLCWYLVWQISKIKHRVEQLNADLEQSHIQWEQSLRDQTLALTHGRSRLRQWQLYQLRWRLLQRQLMQLLKLAWQLRQLQRFYHRWRR